MNRGATFFCLARDVEKEGSFLADGPECMGRVLSGLASSCPHPFCSLNFSFETHHFGYLLAAIGNDNNIEISLNLN